MMLYATLGTNDLARGIRFYNAIFVTLGHERLQAFDGWAAWGQSYDKGFSLWLCPPFDGASATSGNGTMFSFGASSAAMVRAFHAAALANGGSDDGPPGIREAYGPAFYVAYVRDPDGHKISAVYRHYDPQKDI